MRRSMVKVRTVSGGIVTLVCLLLSPAAWAPASIAGAARDTRGAVRPGGTVEGTRRTLSQQRRAVSTNSEGQYLIVDLRPGHYEVTFTLTGFSTLRREGIELTGSATATVNADLRVGALEETVTV